MSFKSVQAVKQRRKFFIKCAVWLLLIGGALFFVKEKKEMLIHEASNFLQSMLSRETELTIHIGKISGKVNGVVRFEDVRLEDPALPVGLRLMFHAKQVEVHYKLMDFLTKKFDSKVRVKVMEPALYLRPRISIKRGNFGSFDWLRDVLLSQRSHLGLEIRDLRIIYGEDKNEFSNIDADYEDDRFSLTVPVRHWDILGHDVSTQLNIQGQFELGLLQAPDSLKGQISTEGSVINWKPLPWESSFDFMLTRDKFSFKSASFLGGFSTDGSVDLEKDRELQMEILTKQYPLTNFQVFLAPEAASSLKGRLDLDAKLKGALGSPNLEAYARISGGRSGKSDYKAMDLHVVGVYPTLQLSDSHVILDDGSAMRFADKTVEFKDLFNSQLYHNLVSGSDQDTVVMGDWEFKRPTDENQRPEFMMQRSFGENVSMHVRKFNESSEEKLDSPEDHNMEVGFEYRLKGKDSLKFEMREDEKFVGIERKMSF